MADITAATPVNLPLNPPAASSLALSPGGVLPVQLVDVPEALRVGGQSLNLTGVLQLAANNHLALNTAFGNIVFSLPFLRVNPQLIQFLLPYLDGAKQAQLLFTPAAASGGTAQASLMLGVTPTPASGVSAHTSTAETPASLIGKNLTALILPPEQTAPQTAQTAAPAAAKPAQSGTATLPPGTTALQQAPPPALPAFGQAPPLAGQGQSFQTQLRQIIPPGQPLPALAADEFLATVTGFSPVFQQPVAATGNSSILLKTPVNLSAGSLLVLQYPSSAIAGTPEDQTDQSWPVLKEILAQARSGESAPLHNFLQHRLPQMNQNLPGAMLFLLSAFNRGDIRQWLGAPAIEALERSNKKHLVAGLQEEMRQATAAASDSVVGQWRAYHLPWLDNGQLAPMHLYVHHEQQQQRGDAGTENGQTRKTRFIVDLAFTRLGAIQLDGFVQRGILRQTPEQPAGQPPRNQFDLMLRSEQPLDPALRQELRLAFHDAISAMGYTGQMLFQQGTQGWMRLGQMGREVIQV